MTVGVRAALRTPLESQSPRSDVVLGAGLTRLGRPWGVHAAPVPSDEEAHAYLRSARSLGVRVFDTAPSYGSSEERLGRFLRDLPAEDRNELFIATKFGESWDAATGAIVIDHSFDALARSMERSLQRLGTIDLLQLHRATAQSLASSDVRRACDAALAAGVGAIGASVSRMEDAQVALEVTGVHWLQLPYHAGNTYMADAFALAASHRCRVMVNRPFGMGALVVSERAESAVDAFRAILSQRFSGVVLTGTASTAHLRENVAAFGKALRAHEGSTP